MVNKPVAWLANKLVMEFFSMFEMWLKHVEATLSCDQPMLNWRFGARWCGYLGSLMKGVVTYGYPDSNPKPPGPKPPIFTISWWELPLFEVFACGQVMLWNLGEGASECWTCSSLGWWNDWIQRCLLWWLHCWKLPPENERIPPLKEGPWFERKWIIWTNQHFLGGRVSFRWSKFLK